MIRKTAFGAMLLLVVFATISCVGEDAEPRTSSPTSSGGSDDGDSSTPPTPTATSDAASDAEAGGDELPGGVTLAQLRIEGDGFPASIAPAVGGGVLLSFVKPGGPEITIAGVPIAGCNTCSIAVKLTPTLNVQWWMTFEGGYRLTQSANGNTYWLLQADGGAATTRQATLKTNTIGGSVSTKTFDIPGCCGGQEEYAGGAVIVVALDGNGAIRWTHMLSQTNLSNPYPGNVISSPRVFAASDNRVVIATTASGTLEYTNVLGNRVSKVLGDGRGSPSHFVYHVLDASTGRTFDLQTTLLTDAHREYGSFSGTQGLAGSAFVGAVEDYPVGGTGVASSTRVANIGADVQSTSILNPLASTPALFHFATYQNIFGMAAVDTNDPAMTFGGTSGAPKMFAPPAGHGKDAMFFLFDNASPNVKASMILGGSGREVATAITDARNGSGGSSASDVYAMGQYASSDMTVAGVTFPPTTGAGAFVVRAKVNAGSGMMDPVWARGISGSGMVVAQDIATDLISSDVYMTGYIYKGKADFGLGDIASSGKGLDGAQWIVRLRR